MNDDPDADLERRLARLRPTALPEVLARRLHFAEPLRPVSTGGWQPLSAVDSLRGLVASLCRPWPLAYAGVLTAWLLVLILRLATPPSPAAPTYSPTAQTSPAVDPLPAFIGGVSVDRTALLSRNQLPDPWP